MLGHKLTNILPNVPRSVSLCRNLTGTALVWDSIRVPEAQDHVLPPTLPDLRFSKGSWRPGGRNHDTCKT